MKTLRTILFALLSVALSVALIGCQPQATGPATVRVLTMEQAGPTVDEMNAIVADFNKANPEIKSRSSTSRTTRCTTRSRPPWPPSRPPMTSSWWTTSGTPSSPRPAMYWTPRSHHQGHARQDLPRRLDITTVGGKVYGMPWLLDEKYFFYNEDLLNQAGISAPPATWEELLDQAKILKDKGVVEFPIVCRGASTRPPSATG